MALPQTVQKHPSEVLLVSVDFTYRLAVAENISTATAAKVGTSTITVGASPSVSSPVVTATVSAGTDGAHDSFTILAVTDAGETLAAVVNVDVSATDF